MTSKLFKNIAVIGIPDCPTILGYAGLIWILQGIFHPLWELNRHLAVNPYEFLNDYSRHESGRDEFETLITDPSVT